MTEAKALARGERERLPNRRRSVLTKVKIGDQNVYFRIGRFADGRIAEVFVDVNKTGTAFNGLLGSMALAISLGLQYGAPLGDYTSAMRGIAFEPDGAVEGDKRIKKCASIVDLLMKFLAAEEKGEGPVAVSPPARIKRTRRT